MIYRARKAKGWTQEELAERMGVLPAYIGQLESSEKQLPKPDRFELLERVLEVPRAEMLRELGYLGPAESFDFISEARRVLQLPTPEEQEAALEAFPLEYLQILRAMVALASQLAFRRVG